MGRKIKWAIVGGGNGGQSVAGHLALMGYSVRLYDIFPHTIDAINALGGIKIGGVVEGFGKLELATLNMGEALAGADVVLVTAPATAHRAIAEKCAASHRAAGSYRSSRATCGARGIRRGPPEIRLPGQHTGFGNQ